MKVDCVRVSHPKPIPSFAMDQKVAIELKGFHGNDKSSKVFRGEVISITKRLIVVQKESGNRESFLLKDFLTGHARLVQ